MKLCQVNHPQAKAAIDVFEKVERICDVELKCEFYNFIQRSYCCVAVHFRIVPIMPNLMPNYGSMTVYVDVSIFLFSFLFFSRFYIFYAYHVVI